MAACVPHCPCCPQDSPASYPKLPLSLEALQSLFQQQLRLELGSVVHVTSVEKAPLPTQETLHAVRPQPPGPWDSPGGRRGQCGADQARALQRQTLKTLRDQWEADLHRGLQETKARLAREAHKGHPSLYPYLCLLSEGELVQLLMQVGRGLGMGP